MQKTTFALLILGLIFIGCKKGDNPFEHKIVLPDIETVTVEGGTFMMGSTGIATPVHSVTLSTFNITKYEITQKLWKVVMDTNPSEFKGDSLPVDNVSWNDVQEFITKLNQLSGRYYRLPTEAEWEYAARGGKQSLGYAYAGSDDVDAVAWHSYNSGGKTHPVGTKAPNELGIYDMSGNVMEWCSDWYGNTYYSVSPDTNPQGPSSGVARVLRGGSWYDNYIYCGSAKRNGDQPMNHINILGVRLVLDPMKANL